MSPVAAARCLSLPCRSALRSSPARCDNICNNIGRAYRVYRVHVRVRQARPVRQGKPVRQGGLAAPAGGKGQLILAPWTPWLPSAAQVLVPVPTRLDRLTDGATRPPPVFKALGTFGDGHNDALSRLAVLDPVLVDGQLCMQRRLPGRRGFETVDPRRLDLATPLELEAHQSYGVHPLQDHDGWQALPGLHPAEQLVQLATAPERPYRLRRDCETGLHHLALALPDSGRTGQGATAPARPMVVHYVLELSPLAARPSPAPVDDKPHPDAGCDSAIAHQLDSLLAEEARARFPQQTALRLEAIVSAPSPKARVEAIFHYCREFRCDRAPAAGEDLLAFMLRERQGSCRHRACVYVLLCRYWGIAARLVRGHGHMFAEYSLDAGHSWHRHNSGGLRVRVQPAPVLPFLPHRHSEDS